MEAIFVVIATAISCIGCFIIGAKVGQTVAKGEKIETPTINPMKAMREHQSKKEAEAEQNRIDTIMQNIDSYDGTSNGQKDVPRG